MLEMGTKVYRWGNIRIYSDVITGAHLDDDEIIRYDLKSDRDDSFELVSHLGVKGLKAFPGINEEYDWYLSEVDAINSIDIDSLLNMEKSLREQIKRRVPDPNSTMAVDISGVVTVDDKYVDL